jgi:4-hydroxybenzoyl-CoA thioesterase
VTERYLENEIEFRVEWADSDPAEIAFYPNFFKWFDLGNWHLLDKAGLGLEIMRREFGLVGCPIIEARSKFTHPARFWDVVRLRSAVRSFGRKTFEVGHEVRIAGVLCAEGTEVRVCARAAPGKAQGIEAVPIPEQFRRRLGG